MKEGLMMEKAKLEKDFSDSTKIIFEHSLEIEGKSYLIIFGHHINGGFICIPSRNIGCEISDLPYRSDYNTKRLIEAGLKEKTARMIADYIEESIS